MCSPKLMLVLEDYIFNTFYDACKTFYPADVVMSLNTPAAFKSSYTGEGQTQGDWLAGKCNGERPSRHDVVIACHNVFRNLPFNMAGFAYVAVPMPVMAPDSENVIATTLCYVYIGGKYANIHKQAKKAYKFYPNLGD